jgi:hypothetical protein
MRYDILNDLLVDALIEPMARDERSLAREHLEKLAGMASLGKELVLFDRGYPSWERIRWLQDKRIDFLMRVRQKFDTEIDALPRGDHQGALEQGGTGPVRVRVIQFRLPTGEIETLITRLRGKEYKTEIFKGLYFKRWPIETKYDEIKQKLEVENFSGRLVDTIRKDFYESMYW